MNVSAHHKLFAMVLSLGLIAGCSSTGETTEDGAYGSDVSAVDQDGGSTVYGGDDDGGVSSSEMSEEQRREAEARAARAEEAAMREITTFTLISILPKLKPKPAKYWWHTPGSCKPIRARMSVLKDMPMNVAPKNTTSHWVSVVPTPSSVS